MNSSGPDRREFLAAVSSGCVVVAGCSGFGRDEPGYGTAYAETYGSR